MTGTSVVAVSRGNGLQCPLCRVDLVMSEKLGVEIDYCPTCRGIWLDRGELDKIVERSVAEEARYAQAAPPRPAVVVQPYQNPEYPPRDGGGGYSSHHGSSSHGYGGHGRGGHGRKHGILGRLFD